MEEAGAAKALWILEKQNIQKQWTSRNAATYNHADSCGIFSRFKYALFIVLWAGWA